MLGSIEPSEAGHIAEVRWIHLRDENEGGPAIWGDPITAPQLHRIREALSALPGPAGGGAGGIR